MSKFCAYVGRQPIFDRKGNIFGYELLYRNSEVNRFPNIDPEQATIELLINTFFTIGIDKLAGKTRSFINFSDKLLQAETINQLNPDQVIIEVLEDVRITDQFIDRLEKIKRKGFKIALDDFVLSEEVMRYERLFKIVNIIKIDFMSTTSAERKRMEIFAKRFPNITLLAEKVETYEEYQEAQRSGYLLFQGYYFAKPEVIKSKEIPTNYAIHFYLLQKFNEEEPNVKEISEILMRDVSLSYKILRYINSLAFGVPNRVSSIQQAIMLMGLKEASRWLRILLLREFGNGTGKGRELALVMQSLTRAKIMELLAKFKSKRNAEEYFLTGMFSLIDTIMQTSMEEILPELALSDEIAATLLGGKTDLLAYLQLSIAIEQLDVRTIQDFSEQLGINEKGLTKIISEAHKWVMKFN